jgi:hypothetical protein
MINNQTGMKSSIDGTLGLGPYGTANGPSFV